MSLPAHEVNWDDILNKFSSHKGTITEFCKENNINSHHLYYRRKRLKAPISTAFHAISLNKLNSPKENNLSNKVNEYTEIKIEIGKAKIYVSSQDSTSLSNIIKELCKIC